MGQSFKILRYNFHNFMGAPNMPRCPYYKLCYVVLPILSYPSNIRHLYIAIFGSSVIIG